MTTYIFPHAPKTGGSTINKLLQKSGLNVFLDYEFPPRIEPFHAKNCERRNTEYSLLDFSPFDIVFGHFPMARYRSENYEYI